MIGLGSNRLTVCRRGGMSVTQAGRGGMEWLAGGRMPSWASPYSAQATAALKAQFSAEQWATIRDYGFSHPALVPFINEDPMLVMSLIAGLGRRIITTDKNAYIDTGVKATSNTDCEIDFSGLVNVSGSEHILFGARNGSWSANYGINGNSLGRNGIYAYYNYDGSTGISLITAAIFKLAKGKLYINGEERYSKTYNTFSFNLNIYIFGTNNGGTHQYAPVVEVARFKIWESDTLSKELVPFKSATQGNGMLDLVTLTFHPKQGSGTLTISETPAS